MFYVYILINETKTRTYTGCSDDVARSLKEHNAGKVKASRPYRIMHTESFVSLSEARARERYYKTTSGRRKIKEKLI